MPVAPLGLFRCLHFTFSMRLGTVRACTTAFLFLSGTFPLGGWSFLRLAFASASVCAVRFSQPFPRCRFCGCTASRPRPPLNQHALDLWRTCFCGHQRVCSQSRHTSHGAVCTLPAAFATFLFLRLLLACLAILWRLFVLHSPCTLPVLFFLGFCPPRCCRGFTLRWRPWSWHAATRTCRPRSLRLVASSFWPLHCSVLWARQGRLILLLLFLGPALIRSLFRIRFSGCTLRGCTVYFGP